ncbi:hypothetical protein GCM10010195_72250 [Kitasatospora griseola]|nr:hypothetical protein GCM10010195_72250 [Kitasatospora griseola]
MIDALAGGTRAKATEQVSMFADALGIVIGLCRFCVNGETLRTVRAARVTSEQQRVLWRRRPPGGS